jgi:AraC-like DNA-binding protein
MKTLHLLFYAIFLLPTLLYAQNGSNNSSRNDELIARLMKLSFQQLLDTGDYYFNKINGDTALICYLLVVNTPVKEHDTDKQKGIAKACIKSAAIYYYMCDYGNSFECLIKAMRICEKYNHVSYLSKIYTNLGNIYYHFSKPEAKWHYLTALEYPQDSASYAVLLSNLGAVELEFGNLDSAAYFLNRSLEMSKTQDRGLIASAWNNMALLYQKKQLYDSAILYFHLSLDIAKKSNMVELVVENLAELGKLFFKINKTDSALFYIESSNSMAKEYKLLRILADNYLTMSKIEEAKGNTKKSFHYYKVYDNIKDSIFNTENIVKINHLRRVYETSITDQEIEQLVIEKQIKERTIYYQKIIWIITLSVLLLVTFVLLLIFTQKRRLNKAYKALVEKNIEIINLQKKSLEKHSEKQPKTALANEIQEELIDKILNIMEDVAIICDTAFTINTLASMTQSNHTYVSQVINCVLKKNFRAFLNSYRIREAQRLFSEPEAAKYTIEAVSLQVGFKSRSAFRDAFKEITGVSPGFYLKSMERMKE